MGLEDIMGKVLIIIFAKQNKSIKIQGRSHRDKGKALEVIGTRDCSSEEKTILRQKYLINTISVFDKS